MTALSAPTASVTAGRVTKYLTAYFIERVTERVRTTKHRGRIHGYWRLLRGSEELRLCRRLGLKVLLSFPLLQKPQYVGGGGFY